MKILIMHGIIMALAFLILFPLGAIIIRFISTFINKPARSHQILQLGSLVLVLIGGGLGFYLAVPYHFRELRTTSGETTKP